MKNKPKLSEKGIQKQITDWLSARGIFWYRQNTGAFKDKTGHLYHFGSPGAPDLVAIKDGRYIGIEVKASNGVPSENQVKFLEKIQDSGGLAILAYSLEDVMDKIK